VGDAAADRVGAGWGSALTAVPLQIARQFCRDLLHDPQVGGTCRLTNRTSFWLVDPGLSSDDVRRGLSRKA
jgi:hypothetical protein